jgi:DNA-binding CsgD family transcriptional regulator/tetratricopeptide (TPR) repeat protein
VQLVGRRSEMSGVNRFLELLPEGPAALVLEGDPGIGKTTVWRTAIDAVRSRSYRVLVCRASESERALSFLGLGDLFESVADEDLEDLPEPQRFALELALLRSASPGQSSPDRVGVARGTLNALRASAAKAPTVVAIDDAHWLDPPSADVLRFVAHRLTDEPLGFVVSERTGRASSLELDQAFPRGALVRIRLGALSFEELEEVVRLHLAVAFTRPTWRALHRISEGNPFFALQLAEAIARRGGRLQDEGLSLPERLADVVRERLTVLSPSARAALLPIAALAQPTLSLVGAGAAQAEGVEEAVRAGVLQIDAGRLRFAHPLLSSFVYGDASQVERRAVHRRLAPLVADPEENALHIGRGELEPNESTAATIEATADRAAARGHPEIAAELAEHSARLTPVGRSNARARRIRKAASFVYAAGDGPRSRELLEELVEHLPPSEERARALRLLGWFVDDAPRSVAILEQALGETSDDQLSSQLLSLLSMKESWRGHWTAASRHLRKAVKLAERSGGGAALATARARLAWTEVGPAQLPEIERAVELERSLSGPLPFPDSPSFLQGVVLLAVDQLDAARRRLEESYERAVALGDSYRLVHLGWLAELELRAGNWKQALAHARASEDLGRQFGLMDAETWGSWSRALVEAHLGNMDAAAAAAERASRLARAIGFHIGLARSETALGFLYLSAGDEAAALHHLLPLLDEGQEVSLHACMPSRTFSNAIEAFVGSGELDRAKSLAGRLEEHARSMPVPSSIAAAARCRALVLAQDRDLEGARASIEDALAAHARLREPFELGRTYLAQGSIERRAKQKAEARVTLRRAEAIFAELGARLWLERARGELARTGLTRSDRRELTPTELRVAELAAKGSQNKEIAGALFVSVKTVEANLSRVYAKLGIRSRVELASQLARRDT